MAPPPERRRRATPTTRAAALTLAISLALSAATCSDDEDPPNRTTSTTEATSSTTTPEDEVEAAYLAYWDMAVRLAQAPNPDDPEIGDRASGRARGNLVDGLTTLRSANQRTEPGQRYGHDVLSVQLDQAAGSATVQDCAVDESRLLDVATGQVIAEGTTTTLWSVRMRQEGNMWRVDEFHQVDAWAGAVECR